MKIIFGFSRPKKERILSKIIRSVEKRPFSHSYVRFNDPTGLDVIFQASGLAVNLCSIENFLQIETIVEEYEIEIDDSKIQSTWEHVVNQLGTPYSILQLFWILINKILGLEISHNNGNAVICSETSARFCIYLGILVPGDLDYETPSDFQKFCVKTMKKRDVNG